MVLNLKVRYIRLKEIIRIRAIKKQLDLSDVTIFSQNCIGGVMYHDCGAKFLSPTINLYMLPSDFMRFVQNYEKYFAESPQIKDGEKYPIGVFSDGLQINFMHYENKKSALEAWERRKYRINREKIFVISIERDGFNENNYKEFKSLPFHKVLFTRNEMWKDDVECIFISKYKNKVEVPDIIPGRMMYYKKLLYKKVRRAFE